MRPRIFLADDHLMVRQGLKGLLEGELFMLVAVAADGREAVRPAQASREVSRGGTFHGGWCRERRLGTKPEDGWQHPVRRATHPPSRLAQISTAPVDIPTVGICPHPAAALKIPPPLDPEQPRQL